MLAIAGILLELLILATLFSIGLVSGDGGRTGLGLFGGDSALLLSVVGADLDEPAVDLGFIPEGLNELLDDLLVIVDAWIETQVPSAWNCVSFS